MSDNKLGQLPSASDNIAGLCEILRKANDPPPDAWLALKRNLVVLSIEEGRRLKALREYEIEKERAESDEADLLKSTPPATAQKSERRL